MALDFTKLEKLVKKSDGKIIARCPACAAAGGDTNGEHLVMYRDGRYGCVVHPSDREHNKEIFKIAGKMESVLNMGDGEVAAPRTISVNAFQPPPSEVLMDLGTFKRFSKKPFRYPKPVPVNPSTIPKVPTLVPTVQVTPIPEFMTTTVARASQAGPNFGMWTPPAMSALHRKGGDPVLSGGEKAARPECRPAVAGSGVSTAEAMAFLAA